MFDLGMAGIITQKRKLRKSYFNLWHIDRSVCLHSKGNDGFKLNQLINPVSSFQITKRQTTGFNGIHE